MWKSSVLPFCYQPPRLGSVILIEVIWFAVVHVRYLHKDAKHDIRSMGDLLYSEAGRTSLGISKGSRWFLVCQHQCFSSEHKCVNEANCQVIPTPWVWVVELSRRPQPGFFLLKIRYISYILHQLMDIQFKARSSSKQPPLKFLHSGPLSCCFNSTIYFYRST